MLSYLPTYRVLICNEHQYAICSLDEHLKRYHKLPINERRELQKRYSSYTLQPPADVRVPEPYSAPIQELGIPQDAFHCCCQASCSFISTSQSRIKKHINQQHNIQLTRWSTALAVSYAEHTAQLWQPVRVQTFFRKKRYLRYFIVQEQQPEQPEQQQRETGQADQQQHRQETAEQDQATSYHQRLAYLSREYDAVERNDSEAIERIAEEADAKDRTGWFKRTQWDEHLQAYSD
jgi:hypothetical protein